MLHAKLKATPGWWVFFLFPPSQMTEQRKNKQRLGFLGPPQPNHHIPAHWRRTGGAHGSDGTQWRATRLQAHSKIKDDTNSSLKNNTCIQSALTITDVKKNKKRQTPAHHFWLGAFFLRHSHGLTGYKPCLMRSLGHEWQRGGGNSSLWMICQPRHTSSSVV